MITWSCYCFIINATWSFTRYSFGRIYGIVRYIIMSKEDTLPGTITIGDDSSSVSVLSAISSDS